MFLLVGSLTFTGVLSTVWLYDSTYNGQHFLIDGGSNSLAIEKKYNVTLNDGSTQKNQSRSAGFSSEDIKELNNNNLGLNFIGVYTLHSNYVLSFYDSVWNEYYHPCNYFCGLTDCGEDYILKNGFAKIAGHYPTNDKEIAISEATLDSFKIGKYDPNVDYWIKDGIEINSAEDIIGRKIKVCLSYQGYDDYSIDLVVSGVYKFDDFDFNLSEIVDKQDYAQRSHYMSLYNSSFSGLGYVTKSFIEKYKPYFDNHSQVDIELKSCSFNKYYVLNHSDYNFYKENNRLDDSYKYYSGCQVSSVSDFKEQANKFIITDNEGNKLTSVPTLGKNEALVNLFSEETYDCLKELVKQSSREIYYVYNRNGEPLAIGKSDGEVGSSELYYNEETKEFSTEPKTDFIKITYLMFSDNGELTYYYKSGDWYSCENKTRNRLKYVDLSTFFYDSSTKKVLTGKEAYVNDKGIAVAVSDGRVVKAISLYTVNSNGEPDEKYGNEIPKQGLFVNKNTGEYSFTKKNDDYVFTTGYWIDESGKIVFGTRVDKTYVKNGETFYTKNLVPFGYSQNTSLAHITGYLSDKPEVIKSIKRYCNFYKLSSTFIESYKDFDNLNIEQGFDSNDIKIIITAYKNYLTEFGNDTISFLGALGLYSITEQLVEDIDIKGFYANGAYNEYIDSPIVMSDERFTDNSTYTVSNVKKTELTTKYDYEAPREYSYAIAKSDFSNKHIDFAFKTNNDDSYYAPVDDIFDYEKAHVDDADDMRTALIIIVSLVFLYCFICMAIVVHSKKADTRALKQNGIGRIHIVLSILISVFAIALVTSGVSSLLSLFIVNNWNKTLKAGAYATILNFSFVNFLLIFGCALVIIGLPTLVSCLVIKEKKKA